MAKSEEQVERISNPYNRRDGSGSNYTHPMKRGRLTRQEKVEHAQAWRYRGDNAD